MTVSSQLGEVDHIVHLMLENRSFDHMLGFLYAERGNQSLAEQPFEGLTGAESNPGVDGKPVSVFQIAPSMPHPYLMPGANPGEGFFATEAQLFGATGVRPGQLPTNNGFVVDFAKTLSWEAPVPSWHVIPGTIPADIMAVYTPEALPILSGLARGYAVCDHWFSSVPTETMPNRAFASAGTSLGQVDDKTHSFATPSIFGLLTSQGLDWRIYGYRSPPMTRLNFPDTKSAPESHFGRFVDFQRDAAAGTLPSYAFLEPDWASTGNSQHPNYDVAKGEILISDVYQALRLGPSWNKTLLVITYDEHGGCYDHVPPPWGAIPPDDTTGEYAFDFRRFGVRVPAILVSPWISLGTVFRVADGSMPLDHTSILATVEQRFGLPNLTYRDKIASSFGAALTEASPRTDDPLAGVQPPAPSAVNPAAEEPSHLQRIHAELVAGLSVRGKRLPIRETLASLRTNADFAAFIDRRTAEWIRSETEARRPG